jgi:hypothetical protein
MLDISGANTRSLFLFAIAFAASGCVDPMVRIEELAGDGAISCGYAATTEERAAVIACGMAADDAGEAWYGGWLGIGRDTEIRDYRVRDVDGVAWVLRYSSEDSNRLNGQSCGRAPYELRESSPPVGDDLVCTEFGGELVELGLGP